MAFKDKRWFDTFTPPEVSLVGHTFSRWTVASFAGTRGGITYWNCYCSCGNKGTINKYALLGERSTSCGCYRSEQRDEVITKKLSIKPGDEYGRLTIVDPWVRIDGVLWCGVKCVCGTELNVRRHHIISGNTQSCGCLHSEVSAELTQEITKKRKNKKNAV